MDIELMTIQKVAKTLHLADKTVYAMAAAGELPAFKVRGQWRIRRSDLESWLAGKADAKTQLSGLGAQQREPQRDATNITYPSTEIISDLAERVSTEHLHSRLVEALGSDKVRRHSSLETKPFEMDLASPLPQRVRVYMYNITRPPGGRPLGEHKVQLIVPGQSRSQRGSFDNSEGRIVLLIGYAAEEDVFVLWDAGLYPDFAWSRNVQVKAETIIRASAGFLAAQERQLRQPGQYAVIETVLAVKPRELQEAIIRRMQLTRDRLLRD